MRVVLAGISARKELDTPLWITCEAHACLFTCGESTTTSFIQPRRCCEARPVPV